MHQIFDSAQFELIRPVAFAFAFPSPPPPPPSDFHSITFSTIPHHFYQPDQTSYRLSFPTFFPLQSIPIHIHLLILHDFFLFIDLFWWLQFFFFLQIPGELERAMAGHTSPTPSPLPPRSPIKMTNKQHSKREGRKMNKSTTTIRNQNDWESRGEIKQMRNISTLALGVPLSFIQREIYSTVNPSARFIRNPSSFRINHVFISLVSRVDQIKMERS